MIAKDVFITAMKLMGEESQDGAYEGYPDEYKNRSWSVLDMLQAELLPANATVLIVENENSVLQIDDRTARTVLPYGLAAHLLLEEDQNRAAFFNGRYDELKRKRPTKIIPIIDRLGVVKSAYE